MQILLDKKLKMMYTIDKQKCVLKRLSLSEKFKMRWFLILILFVSIFFLIFTKSNYAKARRVNVYKTLLNGSIAPVVYSCGRNGIPSAFVDIDNDGNFICLSLKLEEGLKENIPTLFDFMESGSTA